MFSDILSSAVGEQENNSEIQKLYHSWPLLSNIEKSYNVGCPWIWYPSWRFENGRVASILNNLAFLDKNFGDYSWEFDNTFNYPVLIDYGIHGDSTWYGVLKITNKKTNISFYLSSVENDAYSKFFGFSLPADQVEPFLDDLLQIFREKNNDFVSVKCYGAEDLKISLKDEIIILNDEMYKDIMVQITSFYENKKLYSKLNIPYKRGFLFIGDPGNGKTLMVRHIIKHLYKKYGISATIIGNNGVRFDERGLASVVHDLQIQNKDYPGVLIIDDIDTLTHETHLTRAGFLSVLDGLAPTEGVFILGTTNNPEKIDPALMHRPSRFDRVFKFELPNASLRKSYLKTMFSEIDISEDTYDHVVSQSNNWSFAYLKELYICASLLAVNSNKEVPNDGILMEAFKLLKAQFKNTKDPRNFEDGVSKVGFNVD